MAFTHKERALQNLSLHNIDSVLQNDLTNKHSRIAAMTVQLHLLQAQLAAQDQGQGLPPVPAPGQKNAVNKTPMDTYDDAHDDPMNLQGGGRSSDSVDTMNWSTMLLDLGEQHEHILYVDDTNLAPQGFPEDAIQQSTGSRTGARTRSGRAGVRCWDNDVAVAA
jgi:hypothetical protein